MCRPLHSLCSLLTACSSISFSIFSSSRSIEDGGLSFSSSALQQKPRPQMTRPLAVDGPATSSVSSVCGGRTVPVISLISSKKSGRVIFSRPVSLIVDILSVVLFQISPLLTTLTFYHPGKVVRLRVCNSCPNRFTACEFIC